MASATYLAGRKKYRRPQAMMWSDLPPIAALPSDANLLPGTTDFESNTTGWTTRNCTVASSSLDRYVGTASALATITATGTSAGISVGPTTQYMPAVTVGKTYTFSMWLKDVDTAKQYRAYIDYYDATPTFITGSGISGTVTTISTSSWTNVSITFTVPATVGTTPTVPAYVRPYVYSSTAFSAGDSGKKVYFDAALLQEGSVVNAYKPYSLSYIPDGYEVNAATAGDDFLVLSDHNRKDISFKPERIEKRERMINGRMRSYHIADKRTISTSWDMIPSRAFSLDPQFDVTTGSVTGLGTQYTVDGGAGGNELLDWYNRHTGSFYVFLAYDKKSSFAESGQYGRLSEYGEVIEMFISSFDYNVVKRGGSNFDFWNVSVTLEEV
jgi:preprotein translocase subunit YajC